jgi:hypothetical protein
MERLVNFLGFQAVWFACVLGAAWGRPWVGPLLAALFVVVHVVRCASPREELALIALSALVGYVADSLLVVGGALAFPEGTRLGAPSTLWMVSLWAGFSATLRHSLDWLRGRWGLAAALGLVLGPLSYAAGERLGAIELAAGLVPSSVAVGILWALCMPGLLLIERWTAPAAVATRSSPASEGSQRG